MPPPAPSGATICTSAPSAATTTSRSYQARDIDYVPHKKQSVGIDVASFLKNINGVTNKIKIEQNETSDVEFKEGMNVRHKKFGLGVILTINNDEDNCIAEINFEKFGVKRLIVGSTTLEIV